MDEVYILHECQDSALCGQHCLNNLLQQSIFNAIDLSNIALELDQIERNITMQSNNNNNYTSSKNAFNFWYILVSLCTYHTGNVDQTGNFSYEVLRTALQRICSVNLISWTGDEGRNIIDPTKEQAFIINREHHWFTIRKIKNNWWNLDSLLDKPVHISPFYLTALLGQYRDEECSVFIVHGDLPSGGYLTYDNTSHTRAGGTGGGAGSSGSSSSEFPQAIWWEESRLLDQNESHHNKVYTGPTPDEYGDDLDEDMMLAIALSESLNNDANNHNNK